MQKEATDMKVTMENFAKAKYDVFSMFNEQWGLCTAGNAAEYNTMTIGWGMRFLSLQRHKSLS